MKKNNFILLFLIVVLGAVLRFWGLASVPPSMYWDEVSQGYNTYSILTTGRDEHNEPFPLARFIAFGDYKAPVYIYLDVPFMSVFGKNILGVRFPSALFGSLTVLLAFGLTFELFYTYKRRNLLATSTAFFLAISPWHIQLSRAAYEANIATFFTVLAVYTFFFAKRKIFYLFPVSAISFVLGFYAFNAHRIFIPLVVLLVGVLYWKELLVKKRLAVLLGSCVLAGIVLLPFLMYLRTPESKLRFNEVSIFTDPSVVAQSNRWTAEEHDSKLSHIFDNRRVLFAELYLKHYSDFFDPHYLFFTGDINTRFSLQDTGELYLWELPLLIIGIYQLVIYKRKEAVFIFGWFILSPAGAAVARETPHALRSETFIPTYEMLAAFGFVTLVSSIATIKKIYSRGLYILIGLGISVTVLFFVHSYFTYFPYFYSNDWQYGYKEAVIYAQQVQSKYDIIAVTPYYGRAYIYVLFYGNISPQTYWQIGKVTSDIFGFYTVKQIGKYQFRDGLVDPSDAGKKVLYIAEKARITPGMRILKTINFLNGLPAFIIATNQ